MKSLLSLLIVVGAFCCVAKGETPSTQPAKELTLKLDNTVTMKMVLIPAGKFTMGSPENERGYSLFEGPQHEVTISKPFYMGTCEVTQEQWTTVMGTTPWKGKMYGKDGATFAASYISWNDAVDFCRKLSVITGRPIGLPSEAMWEYACRAGTKTPYYYGDDEDQLKLGDYAWFDKNASNKDEKYAHAVGQKRPNAFGLYDMHGNVEEWCFDWFADTYKGAKNTDPVGPSSGEFHVHRGGSWDSVACRSAGRAPNDADHRWGDLGFRVITTATAPGAATRPSDASGMAERSIRTRILDVAKDEDDAVKRFRKAAEAGDTKGMVSLGFLYAGGCGVVQNEPEAVTWYRKAAEAGDAEGMVNLGLAYYAGFGVDKNNAKAIERFRKASKAGYAEGKFKLEAATGTVNQDAEAMQWLRKAAEAGNPYGMFVLGDSYIRVGRKPSPADAAEAVNWLSKAGEAGVPMASNLLGNMYGLGLGVTRDRNESLKWSNKAAQARHPQDIATSQPSDAAAALVKRGDTHAQGLDGIRDEAEAVKWYRKAAELGQVKGMVKLSYLYANGLDIAKDYVEAAKWLRKASEAGDTVGMLGLGLMYTEGLGVVKDATEAVKWYRKAAEGGDATGMFVLGVAYAEGRGVAKDNAEAVKWYRKAAEAAEANGMYLLGVAYSAGEGVSKDEAESLKWIRKASVAGHPKAKAMLEKPKPL